jgi:hypothetical protein
MAALFYLFFTDSEFTSQEKLFVFFQVVVVTVLLPLLVFLLLKTAWYRLYNACQGIPTKIPLLIHCFC